MLKLFLLSCLLIFLAACSTNKYVGKNTHKYQQNSCEIAEECRLQYGSYGYLVYTVEETGPNTYLVSGKVDLSMQVVGGMYPKISFYVLFMDGRTVQYERRVRTGTRKATFEFEVETNKPISQTSIEHLLFHTWS